MTGMRRFTIARQHALPGLDIRIVQYHWRQPHHHDGEIFHAEKAYLNLALTPRPDFARARIGGMQDMQHPGRIFYVPPSTEFRSAPPRGPVDHWTLACVISNDFLREQLGSSDWSGRNPEACLDLRSTRIGGGLRRIAEEMLNPGFASQAMIETLSLCMGIDLNRHLHGNRERPGRVADSRWKCLLDRLHAPDLPPPDLRELAELTRLSPRHLARLYRERTGTGLGDAIRQITTMRAREWLDDRDRPIKQIAHDLGFSTPGNFSAAFYAATGSRPGEYRRAFRNAAPPSAGRS